MVKEVRSFERIAYLIATNHKELVRRERKRNQRGKGRLIQQMVVITLPTLI